MKIVFYSPYMPKHSGGGEKYILDCIQALLDRGQDQVYLALSSQEFIDQDQASLIIKRYQRFFNCDLSGLKVIATPLGTKASLTQRLWWTRQFDVLYYVTDGSLFFSLAKKNILHIQIPLKLNKRSLLERLKLKSWKIKNSNSYFTKNYVEKEWGIKIDVVHQPLVDLKEFPQQQLSALKKAKIILHVGRFFRQLHSKRQDILVEMFAKLLKQDPQLTQGWQLYLVGSVEDQQYAQAVADQAKDLPIKIYHDLDRTALLKIYQQAKIYWHATGYGLDEDQEASAMEHFGIAPIEAMAAYEAPVLINKGGHKEILGETLTDNLWQEQEQAIDLTLNLIADQKLWQNTVFEARKRAETFNRQRFEQVLFKMVS